jgi:hypothetical protein
MPTAADDWLFCSVSLSFDARSLDARRPSTRRIGADLQAISAQLHAAPPTRTLLALVYKVQHALITLPHTTAIRIRK